MAPLATRSHIGNQSFPVQRFKLSCPRNDAVYFVEI